MTVYGSHKFLEAADLRVGDLIEVSNLHNAEIIEIELPVFGDKLHVHLRYPGDVTGAMTDQWVRFTRTAQVWTDMRHRLLNDLRAATHDMDKEVAHARADDLLLAFIGDAEITAAFNAIEGWYA